MKPPVLLMLVLSLLSSACGDDKDTRSVPVGIDDHDAEIIEKCDRNSDGFCDADELSQ